jgi:AcrR family transcriptional regulator
MKGFLNRRVVNDSDKASKRIQILSIATPLFEKYSYNRISMEQVAQKAGIAKGTLYLYFKTKEELCLAIHSNDYSDWFGELNQLLISSRKEISAIQFAKWFCESLRKRSRFLNTLPIVPIILEQNISLEAARNYKSLILNHLIENLLLLKEKLNLTSKDVSKKLFFQIHGITVGLWSHGFPVKVVEELLKEEEFKDLKVDYFKVLEETIQQLIQNSQKKE